MQKLQLGTLKVYHDISQLLIADAINKIWLIIFCEIKYLKGMHALVFNI